MARYQHTLKQTRSNAMPDTCIVFDAPLTKEPITSGGKLVREHASGVYSIKWRYEQGLYCREAHQYSATGPDFWEYVRRQLRPKVLTWLFGLRVKQQLIATGLFDLMEVGEWKIESSDPWASDANNLPDKDRWKGFCVLEDPPCIVCCRPGSGPGTLKIIDVANYGVQGWEALPQRDNRCEALRDWINSVICWLKGNEYGTLQNTAGSQAFYTFRHSFLDVSLECHTNQDALDLESAAYYGGRCEARYIGEVLPPGDEVARSFAAGWDEPQAVLAGPVWHLDFNSLYPSVCVGEHLPVQLDRFCQLPDRVDRYCYGDFCDAIAECTICTDKPYYPARHKGKIIYPVGTFDTFLAGPELSWAQLCGHLVGLKTLATYRREPCLSSFMQHMYAHRLRCRELGNVAGEQFVKQMLVALPGRFGMDGIRWIHSPDRKAHRPFDVWYEPGEKNEPLNRYRTFAWQCQRQVSEGPNRDAVPAIAAWITSLARIRLLGTIAICPVDTVLYYDTDSLWCLERGFDAIQAAGLIHETDLGKLKIVARHERVEFRGIKHYIADGRIVCAGLPFGESVKADGTYMVENTIPTMHQLRARKAPEALNISVVRNCRSEYRHGVVGKDGWVTPFKLG